MENNTSNLHVFLDDLDRLTQKSGANIIITATLVENEVDSEIKKYVTTADQL